MIEYTHLDIEHLIPLGTRARLVWDGQIVEGIVLAHHNISNCDHEDYDWPEDAEVADLMSVEVFHVMENWWFETERSEFYADESWYTFEDIVTGRKLIEGGK